jgi:hypothetical protein
MSEDDQPKYPSIKTGKFVFNYIDLYEVAREQLLMHSTVIYGESGDGKSYITNTLLDALSDSINILHIFCPTAKIDKSFPMVNYTSPAFVHETFDTVIISNILRRAAQNREMYNMIANPTLMSKSVKKFVLPLYRTNSEDKLYDKTLIAYRRIKKIEKKFDRENATIDERGEHDEMLVGMYKNIMYNCKKYLRRTKTSVPKEYHELSLPVLFYDIKPCDVILTNDLGDVIQALKKNESVIASNLVTKERHFGITTIHLIQDVTYIKKSDRRQIKVNIFTSPGAISSYISTLQIGGMLKQQLEAASEHIIVADKFKSTKRSYPIVVYLKIPNIIGYTYADPKLELNQKGNVRLYKKLEPLISNSTSSNPLMGIFNK